MNAIQQLIDKHSELLDENPYTYFELAYTRHTGWAAWLCSNSKESDPNRKVLAMGQGHSAEAACADALKVIDEWRPCKGCGELLRGQWNYCQTCIDQSGHTN